MTRAELIRTIALDGEFRSSGLSDLEMLLAYAYLEWVQLMGYEEANKLLEENYKWFTSVELPFTVEHEGSSIEYVFEPSENYFFRGDCRRFYEHGALRLRIKDPSWLPCRLRWCMSQRQDPRECFGSEPISLLWYWMYRDWVDKIGQDEADRKLDTCFGPSNEMATNTISWEGATVQYKISKEKTLSCLNAIGVWKEGPYWLVAELL